MIYFNQADSIYNKRSPPVLRSLSRPEFTRFLTTFVVGKKETSAVWIPATLKYQTRESEAVDCMTAFVVDSDTADQASVIAKGQALQAAGHNFLVHSSYNFAPPDKFKVRFVFFLDQPIPIGTPWRWRDALWPRLMEHLGFGPEGAEADTQCKNADRAYYIPVVRSAQAPTYTCVHLDGKDLDTNAVLGDILAQPLEQFDFRRPYVNREDPTLEVDLHGVAARLLLKFTKRDVRGPIEQVLGGEPTPEGEVRHRVISIFTWALAHVAEEDEESEQLIKLTDLWCEAMTNRYGTRGHESWQSECLRMLVGARAKKPSWDAYRAAQLGALSWVP